MAKLLIFAGTTEGRLLVEALLRSDGSAEITACVATDYGRSVLEEGTERKKEGRNTLRILPGRMSEREMAELMKGGAFDVVIDATHPYAVAATACIKEACRMSETTYVRLLRDRGAGCGDLEGQAIFVDSAKDAAAYLNGTKGAVLLTTGSKELAEFTAVKGFEERLFARVLPMAEVVEACAKLGFQGRQLICMQGPFSYELNAAMLKQTEARYMVTKETGKAGGFDEKLRAALDMGVIPVVIGRKPEENGRSLTEVLWLLEQDYGMKRATHGAKAAEETAISEKAEAENKYESGSGPEDWFPLFINIKNRPVLVVGAGRIASRRIRTLLSFSCRLTVIAPEASEEVEEAARGGRLRLIRRKYEGADLLSESGERAADFVLAASNDRSCNHQVLLDCRKLGIPVNAADRKEESDFYFPGVALGGGAVAGVTAGGRNHSLAKTATGLVREALKQLGEDGAK